VLTTLLRHLKWLPVTPAKPSWELINMTAYAQKTPAAIKGLFDTYFMSRTVAGVLLPNVASKLPAMS
jgi:hypothetical protein